MRALIACLFAAACATTPSSLPAERVHGCWIARGDMTTTFRWLPDAQAGGRMTGVSMIYGSGAPQRGGRYVVEERNGAWAFCQLDTAQGETCWRVADGRAGSLDGGRAFIDQNGERLRISVVSAEGERLIFDGQRDGCD